MVSAAKAVEAVGLSLSIGDAEILDAASFSVRKGSFLAVVGPNGAGKSTLLKCAGGISRGWRGSVFINGEPLPLMKPRDVARRVAWVHQSVSAETPYSVRQFVSMSRFALRPVLGGETDEERAAVQSALETAGVAVIAERRLSSLSGGERQRAMIAAAIAQETDILFLDEPTSYLDYAHQAETLSLIESLNKDKGKTIVMVTHDVNLALHGADVLLAVKKGRTVWQGSPEGLLSGSLMTEIFGTEFEYFRRKGLRMPYVVPKGLVR